MELILDGLKSVLELYAGSLPAPILGLILIIGSLRVILKPLFALAYAIASVTPDKKDDEAVKKIEEHKITKAIYFALDYIASVKLPPKK
jgi:hypothetical protein